MRKLRGSATAKFTLERNPLNRKKTVEEGISEGKAEKAWIRQKCRAIKYSYLSKG